MVDKRLIARRLHEALDEVHELEVSQARDFLNRENISPQVYHGRNAAYQDRIETLRREIQDYTAIFQARV